MGGEILAEPRFWAIFGPILGPPFEALLEGMAILVLISLGLWPGLARTLQKGGPKMTPKRAYFGGCLKPHFFTVIFGVIFEALFGPLLRPL